MFCIFHLLNQELIHMNKSENYFCLIFFLICRKIVLTKKKFFYWSKLQWKHRKNTSNNSTCKCRLGERRSSTGHNGVGLVLGVVPAQAPRVDDRTLFGRSCVHAVWDSVRRDSQSVRVTLRIHALVKLAVTTVKSFLHLYFWNSHAIFHCLDCLIGVNVTELSRQVMIFLLTMLILIVCTFNLQTLRTNLLVINSNVRALYSFIFFVHPFCHSCWKQAQQDHLYSEHF